MGPWGAGNLNLLRRVFQDNLISKFHSVVYPGKRKRSKSLILLVLYLFLISHVDPLLITLLQGPADLCIPSQLAHPSALRKALRGCRWCLSPAVFRVTKSACGEVFIQYQHKQQQTQCSTCACVLISSHKHVLLR